MAKYQVEVTETFYYYILVDTENKKEAINLAMSKIDHLGMEFSQEFSEEGSSIGVESILLVDEEELIRPVVVVVVVDDDKSELYSHLINLK